MSIYSDDLENRFPTYVFTETVDGSLQIVTVTDGGTTLKISRAETLDAAYRKLRESMVGGSEISYRLTTTQRNALSSPVEGLTLLNTTNDNIEKYENSSWEPSNQVMEGNYSFQGLTKIGGNASVDPDGALDIIGTGAADTRIRTTRYQANANGGAGIQLGHSRGTEGTPSALLSGDKLGQVLYVGDDGTSENSSGAFVRAYTTENWSSTTKGCQIRFETIPNGGDNDDLFISFIVSENGYPQAPTYTVATLPGVGGGGGLIYVSDETGGATLAFSDGTNWRRVQDRAIVS
ncbi:MAG: hypothetical protein GY845_25630 [Planctomycetes bacterium]|nr:hypothetical protein [Planctomycetota bacterium]